MHILRLLAVWWHDAQSARYDHILVYKYPKYSPIKNIFSLTDLAINLL